MKLRCCIWEWGLIIVGLAVVAITLSPTIGGDGVVRFQTVQAWLNGEAGYSKFSLVQPALSMPLAWLAIVVGIEPVRLVAYFNLIVFGVLSGLSYREIARKYSNSVGRSWLLLMLGASMFPHHLQHYYGEVLSGLCLFLGVLWVDRRPLLAVLLLALACASTPAMLVPFMAMAGAWILVSRKAVPALAVLLAVAIMLFEVWIKSGGFSTAYLSDNEHGFPTILPYSGKSGFSYPMALGVLSIMMSFGKGLVFYIPALTLALCQKNRAALGLDTHTRWIALVAFAGPVLFYSKWWAWYGGAFWGPRFFLFLCAPACLLMAVMLRDNAMSSAHRFGLAAVVILSAWVAANGYLFGQNDMDACWGNNYSNEFLCWYVPEFSALWHPFVTGSVWNLFAVGRWPYAIWNVSVLLYLLVRIACDCLSVRDGNGRSVALPDTTSAG